MLVPLPSVPPSLTLASGAPDPVADVRIGVLTSQIPPELVDEVIEVTGCREKRRRLLPARAVVYLVLGMCLLSGSDRAGPPGYRAVMRSLTSGLRHLAGASLPVRQAFGKARARLGSKPLELLFDRVRGTRAGPGTPGAFAFGRRVVSWDATTIDAPRTAANLAAFGAQGGGQATPAVRLLALIECGTHAVIEAAFDGAARASEMDLARRVLHALGPRMLLLADRNFKGYQLWTAACAGGADLLWRIPGNWVLPAEKVLPDGSYLAVLRTPEASRQGYRNRLYGRPSSAGRLVRVIDYTVTIRAGGAIRAEDCRLITTLTGPDEAPAAALAALYHERWESEGSYCELKVRLKGAGFALRSKSPDLVCQEMYALLAVYHALCSLQARAAATAGIDPGSISFTVTLRAVRDQANSNDIITRPGMLGRALTWVITDMLADPLEKRRDRHNERAKNPAKRHYQARKLSAPRPPSKASYTITIDTRRTTTTTRRPPKPPRALRPPPPPKPP